MNAEYKDAALFEYEGEKHFCFRSAFSVFEEGLFCGVPVSRGFNASGYPLNTLSNCASYLDPHSFGEPFCFNVEIDGATVCRSMTLESFEKTEENGILNVCAVYKSGVKNVKIHERTLLDSTAVMTRSLVIENTSDVPLCISRLVLHGGGLEDIALDGIGWNRKYLPEEIYSYYSFENDFWAGEGSLKKQILPQGCLVTDCCFNRERFRHPACFIRNNLTGVIYSVNVGWSAGVRFSFDYNYRKDSERALLSYTAEITGNKPLYVLAPGESFVSPEIHFGVVKGSLDDAVNEGIKHIRKTVFNCAENNPVSLAVGAGMGAEHDMSIETSKAFVRQMHEMGAEVFIVDAGWSCPPGKEMQWFDYNGINVPDAQRFPCGISELRDYCHKLGMKFALWMEPERFGKMSETARNHPEWMVTDVYGEKNPGFIDMTVPEAAAFVESEISRVLEEYKPDLLRIDYNVGGNESFAFRDCGTGISEDISLRHFNAVYRMFERLKKKYPDVIFENCAGGGGRTDTGMMKNFNHTWVSDNQRMPRSVRITNGMTTVLPPERVDRLFAGMGCHESGEAAAHIRNTMLGHMSLNVIAPAVLHSNDSLMKLVKHSVSFYKKYVRPVLPDSRIYHHTPDVDSIDSTGAVILELSSCDGNTGFITVFTEPLNPNEKITVYPRGINEDVTYSVYLDNRRLEYTVSGRELASEGITVRLPSSLSSELIMYRKSV